MSKEHACTLAALRDGFNWKGPQWLSSKHLLFAKHGVRHLNLSTAHLHKDSSNQ